MVRMGSPGTS